MRYANVGVRRRVAGGSRRWFLVACVGCAALAATLLAQTNPKGASRVEVARRNTATAASPKLASVKPSERKPLSYYTGGVRGDMFHSPAAPEPVVKPEPPKVEVKAEPEVIDPFVDYAYTGTVMMGDQAVALVENAKTKDGTYVKTGDQLIGGTVTSITDRGITVSIAGKSRTLYKTEDYKLTPLDKSAPYMTPGQGQPGMGGPGMPGMPGMGMPGMGMPGMGGAMGFPGMQNLPADVQQRIQQRFQGVTPEQMQQMRNRFMNRSFEGGGRRRRFF